MAEGYFAELKDWSERKHKLLEDYLESFVKITGKSHGGVVYYVDGFAGPGLYEDDGHGSPLRAAELASELQGHDYELQCINVEADAHHYQNLVKNTSAHRAYVRNLEGEFSEHLGDILELVGSCPAIFFLDPFGLKGIDYDVISRILGRSQPVEVLLRIKHTDIARLAGFYGSEAPGAEMKRDVLNRLYGFRASRSWERCWKTDGSEGLTQLYLDRLREAAQQDSRQAYVYKYPIRTLDGSTKYYLLFVTKHPKGAITMGDVIYNRERDFELEVEEYRRQLEAQRTAGQMQMSMLAELGVDPTEDDIFHDQARRLMRDIREAFWGKRASRFAVREAMLETWFGRVKSRHFTRALKDLESEGAIIERSGPVSDSRTVFTFADMPPEGTTW